MHRERIINSKAIGGFGRREWSRRLPRMRSSPDRLATEAVDVRADHLERIRAAGTRTRTMPAVWRETVEAVAVHV